MGFLEEMSASSQQRLAHARTATTQKDLVARVRDTPPPCGLELASWDIIAEVKRVSPAEGALSADADAVQQARRYTDSGAAMISVLTEPTRFGGSLEDLTEVSNAVTAPVMRKDFLVDPYQIVEARVHGASAVLLIARMLDASLLQEMYSLSLDLGMHVLIEAFDADDLSKIEACAQANEDTEGPRTLVGVNCRDLDTLEVSFDRFAELSDALPSGSLGVAESGLRAPSHCEHVARLGYKLGLVGSSLMRAASPGDLLASMLRAGRGLR